MKFHHIGIACENIEKKIVELENLYSIKEKSDIIFDPIQNVKLVILHLDSGVSYELIEGEKVNDIIKKGAYYYHICFETDDIEEEFERLKKKGAIPVSELNPAVLFENRRVGFLYTSTGLIELLESK